MSHENSLFYSGTFINSATPLVISCQLTASFVRFSGLRFVTCRRCLVSSVYGGASVTQGHQAGGSEPTDLWQGARGRAAACLLDRSATPAAAASCRHCDGKWDAFGHWPHCTAKHTAKTHWSDCEKKRIDIVKTSTHGLQERRKICRLYCGLGSSRQCFPDRPTKSNMRIKSLM